MYFFRYVDDTLRLFNGTLRKLNIMITSLELPEHHRQYEIHTQKLKLITQSISWT